MAGDLKSHVEEHHKDAALAKKKVSMDDLVWLSYNLVVYRYLMEPTQTGMPQLPPGWDPSYLGGQGRY